MGFRTFQISRSASGQDVQAIKVQLSGNACQSSDDNKYFDSVIAKLYENKLAVKDTLVLQMSSTGSHQVICVPCSKKNKRKLIEAGHKSKALSNVKAHLKTPLHIEHVKRFLEEEAQMPKNQSLELSEQTKMSRIETMYDEVQKQFPAKFEQMMYGKAKGNNVRCRSCNQVLSLAPERGNAMFNITEHVKSCKGSSKRKQSSIESFLKSKKPRKPS